MDEVQHAPSREGPTLRKTYAMEDDESMLDNESIVQDRAKILINNDDEALIDNPLLYLRPDEVERKAREVARDNGLQNQVELFIQSGRILRDPEGWRSVPGLTAEQILALETESTKGFWRQPKELRVTILMLCVAAVVQGWTQSAGNGANLHWPIEFLPGVSPDVCVPITGTNAWIFAVVNAATFLSASLFGCWLSDPLNEYFYGRRAAIFISAILIFASSIGGAFTQTWQQLFGCRILLGIGMGCKAAVVPVFAAEVAPAHIRGALVMNWQLFDALGIFLSFTANLILSKTGQPSWRFQTASTAVPTLVLITLIFVCPDSPRFLMKRGPHRYPAAYQTLCLLRGEPLLAAKELLYIHCQMEVESRSLARKHGRVEGAVREEVETNGKPAHTIPRRKSLFHAPRTTSSIGYWRKFSQLFTHPRIRRATLSAVVVMVGQQLCGVNVLAFYSSTFYSDASNKTSKSCELTSLWLSWGIGLTNFIFAFPAYYLIDRRGRRWLLLVTLPALAVMLLATALAFKIPDGSNARFPVVGLFTYIFMVFYSFSMGPVPFTLSAEVFPLENRVVGMSFAVFCNFFGAGLLTLFVPAISAKIGQSGLVGIFAGLNVVTFILVFFFVRETAGAALGVTPGSMTFMSLEELNYIFGVTGRKHTRYQWEVVRPWAWRRYIKRDKSVGDRPEEKLYTWAQSRETQAMQNEAEQKGEKQT